MLTARINSWGLPYPVWPSRNLEIRPWWQNREPRIYSTSFCKPVFVLVPFEPFFFFSDFFFPLSSCRVSRRLVLARGRHMIRTSRWNTSHPVHVPLKKRQLRSPACDRISSRNKRCSSQVVSPGLNFFLSPLSSSSFTKRDKNYPSSTPIPQTPGFNTPCLIS